MKMIDLGPVAGASGYSPTVTVEQNGGSLTITVTDKNGTQTATIETMDTMGIKKELSIGANLNDVKAEGLHTCKSPELAVGILNAPVTNMGYLLEVWKPTNSENAIVQKLTATNGAEYARSYTTEQGWTAWNWVYAKATTAEMLQTLGVVAITDAEVDEILQQ